MAARSMTSRSAAQLILIGEDMVNVAFDAPVDSAPRDQIEDAERQLFELAETGRYDGGFQRFAQALTTRRGYGGAMPSSATASSRAWPPASKISTA